MKSVFRIIFIILFILLLTIAIIPVFLPKTSTILVEREIQAPVEVVFDEVNNMKKLASWNALLKKDTAVSVVYFSPYMGKNSGYKWLSDVKEVGNGEVKMLQTKENSYIKNNVFLDTRNPINETFTFHKISANKTKISWNIQSSEWTYFQRYLSYFFERNSQENMENSIELLQKKLSGMEFDSKQTQNIKPEQIIKEFYKGEKLLAVYVDSEMDTKIFAKNVQNASQRIYKHLTAKLKLNETQFGKPTIFYETWDDLSKTTKIYVGYPVYTELADVQEGLEYKEIPGGNVLKTLYSGKIYDTKAIYDKIINYALLQNIEIGNAWEVYETPVTQKDSAKVYIYHHINN